MKNLQNMHILLLENIHPFAKELFEKEKFLVESLKTTLSLDQLKQKLGHIHVLGIRNKTQITQEILDSAPHLMAVGCFCVGTDQVHLESAQFKKIPVFHASFGNTRSVTEFTIAQIICLARQIIEKNQEMHQKIWNKTSSHCHEIHGKVLGVIGYGHIGSQVSMIAEALGMKVQFYDFLPKNPLGNAKRCETLEECLSSSDFITLHLPSTIQTFHLLSFPQFQFMKKGAYLINTSRGSTIHLPALIKALETGHLAGAAIDVFPNEPENHQARFITELQGLSHVILTPHIGGSTEEAQFRIAQEVSTALIHFIQTGSTLGAINFPKVNSRTA